jgi:hypothetical protein
MNVRIIVITLVGAVPISYCSQLGLQKTNYLCFSTCSDASGVHDRHEMYIGCQGGEG